MSYCLYCQELMSDQLTWSTIFIPGKKRLLCHTCAGKMEVIGEKICESCHKPGIHSPCLDCKRWEESYDKDPLEKNFSIYLYNDFMKAFITKWKYRGDYQLGFVFEDILLQTYLRKIAKIHDSIEIMPIPLSEERGYDRAFNQAEMLAGFLRQELNTTLIRKQGEKQSKKTRKERMSSKNPFNLTKSINKPVLLVDDIYTTGRTIRHAADLLKMQGCPNVYAYTLIRG